MHFPSILLTLIAGLVLSAPAAAGLLAVAGRPEPASPELLSEVTPLADPGRVAVSLANGFPFWYQDGAGRKLQLCLDTQFQVSQGIAVNPCIYQPPAPGAPPSFPGNFGAEAIYWSATAAGSYVSSNGLVGSALLVLALEASGANEAALIDGNQAVFSRIRLRIDVPVAGTYRVTHPYGTFDYPVATPGARAINQTQDLGMGQPQDFLAAMRDRQIDFADPANLPADFTPADDDNGAVVSRDGATVGPFLVPAIPHNGTLNGGNPATFTGGPITVDGVSYIGLPLAPDPTRPGASIDLFQPVTGSPYGTNYFSIELLNPQGDFQLNPADPANPQRVRFDRFQLVGKLFTEDPNQAPVAVADSHGVAVNRTGTIDVLNNDGDLLADDNLHGIDFRAIALAGADGPVLNARGMPRLTATLATAAGGTVRRVTSIPTGRAGFLYSPPSANFNGSDSFQYVVQDTGGLVSAPVTVAITVEDLRISQADYRVKSGKWHLRGSSSDSQDNRVTLFAGPRARLTPDAQSPAVSSDARANAALRIEDTAIGFQLSVDPLPVTAITAARLHVEDGGGSGPVIFSLFESFLGVPFSGPLGGSLTDADLQTRPDAGISTFADAVDAILGGRAYVHITTVAYPAGEIRGPLVRPVIGTAEVRDGSWEFFGHSTASPGSLPAVAAESANRVEQTGYSLRLR